MDNKHLNSARVFKAFCDENRLMIIEMLQSGEKCACALLARLRISQPTLSHHMKILCDCGLVVGRKDGKWTYYSLNEKTTKKFKDFLHIITTEKENCICCCTEISCGGDYE